MRIRSQKRASFFIALIPGAISAGIAALAGMNAFWIAASGLVIFAATFIVAQDFIRTYIASRIRPIYQSFFARNFSIRDLDQEGVVKFIEKEISKRNENKKEILRLEANERYRKEFLGNVSHELKTPVFTIQGYISTLLDGALEDSEVNRKYLERAEKSVDRMINIITDLEQISDLESGALKLEIETLDIVTLTSDAIEALEMQAESRNITLSMDKVDEPIMIRGDINYIPQVLSNLITNSIRYGNEGGSTHVSFVDMFDKVLVEVSDNGIGIPQSDLKRIFERFYRTDKGRSREMGGTGLGLSIVKHILEAHGETISVRSVLGEGSTFAFTLTKA